MAKTMTKATFAEILDATEQLSLEDQENLIHILKNRLRDQKRTELVKDIQEAQQEYAQGQCQPATPQQILEEILA
jgi:hypothetical protein